MSKLIILSGNLLKVLVKKTDTTTGAAVDDSADSFSVAQEVKIDLEVSHHLLTLSPTLFGVAGRNSYNWRDCFVSLR